MVTIIVILCLFALQSRAFMSTRGQNTVGITQIQRTTACELPRLGMATYEDVDYIPKSQNVPPSESIVKMGRIIKEGVSNCLIRIRSIEGFMEMRSLRNELSAAGTGGLVAYGCTNCLYYTIATTIFWFSTPTTQAASSSVAVLSLADKVQMVTSRLPKTIALVWAGSQITKVPRIAGSLSLTPFARKAINQVENTFAVPHKTAVALCSASLLTFTALFYVALVVFSAILM